jgi:cell division protease FtsH
MVMTDEEKKLTAYHEAGHAIVGLNVPQYDPLHKVTIIPRGRALGVTMSLPERDRLSMSRQYCVSRLAMVFGGRVAEELTFGHENVTNGATDDIRQATRLARAMIMEWGMSDKLGPVRYNANEQEVFLGHSVTQSQNLSEATAELIDSEIRKLIDDAEGAARRILTERRSELDLLANALLEHETLSGEDVKALLRGEQIVRPTDDRPGDSGRRSSVPPTGAKPGRGDAPDGLEPEPQPGS